MTEPTVVTEESKAATGVLELQETTATNQAQDTQDVWEKDNWEDNVPNKFKDADGTIDVKAVAKSYVNLEKFRGEAAPKTAAEYKLDLKLSDEVQLNEEVHKEFLNDCLAAGMNSKQVQAVIDRALNFTGKEIRAQAQTKDNTIAALKQAWGKDYDVNIQSAQRAFGAAIGEEFTAEERQRAVNDPLLIKILSKFGGGLKEDTPPLGVGVSAAEDVGALMKSEAYWDKKHKDHDSVVNKVTQFYVAKNAKKSA